MIKGIVFDKDGTLLEYDAFWVAVAVKAVSKVLCNHNCKTDDMVEAMLNAIGAYEGINGILCYGSYAEICDIINKTQKEKGDPEMSFTYEEILDAFSTSVKYGKILPACEDITGFMKALKKKGIKTAVVTTDSSEITDFCLKELGIREYIDKVYTDDGINPTKPNPYYMNCFLKDFSLDKSEVLMVGDTLTDIRFAKNSGVRPISVAKKEEDKNMLLKENDTVVYDISHVIEVL